MSWGGVELLDDGLYRSICATLCRHAVIGSFKSEDNYRRMRATAHTDTRLLEQRREELRRLFALNSVQLVTVTETTSPAVRQAVDSFLRGDFADGKCI